LPVIIIQFVVVWVRVNGGADVDVNLTPDVGLGVIQEVVGDVNDAVLGDVVVMGNARVVMRSLLVTAAAMLRPPLVVLHASQPINVVLTNVERIFDDVKLG
jgi:hypothetical protein